MQTMRNKYKVAGFVALSQTKVTNPIFQFSHSLEHSEHVD